MVRVFVNSVESVDMLNLFFNHCTYCHRVELANCKLIGELKLDLLMNQLREDDDTRMEVLWIHDCEFDENNWSMMIQIVVNMKGVDLWRVEMEEKEWGRLGMYRSFMVDLLTFSLVH